MNILITGQRGLAADLALIYQDHDVTLVSKSTGHCIGNIETWGQDFLDHDMVINCAYSEFDQIKVLEYFFTAWKNHSHKHLITIGSNAADYPEARPDLMGQYWTYRLHKQSLLSAWKQTCFQAIDSKIINPGPIDTDMIRERKVPKMSPKELAKRIRSIIDDPWIRRVDLWL